MPKCTAFLLYFILRPFDRQGKRIGIPTPIGVAGITGGGMIFLVVIVKFDPMS